MTAARAGYRGDAAGDEVCVNVQYASCAALSGQFAGQKRRDERRIQFDCAGAAGMDPLGEEMMLWRDVQLVKKTVVRYHAQHISTAGAVEIIRQASAKACR